MDEQREWPIYALANYDNSGQLLDLCRAHLSRFHKGQAGAQTSKLVNRTTTTTTATNNNNNNNADNCTTSGYQTTLEEATTARKKQTIGEPRAEPARLEWWHLIEVADTAAPSSDDELVGLYRVRVAQLSKGIGRLLSPFVSNELDINNARANQRQQQATSSESAPQAPPPPPPPQPVELAADSLQGARLSPADNQAAQLRRLSWRKRRRLEQTSANNENTIGDLRGQTALGQERHLTSLGKTFGLRRTSSGPDASGLKKEHHDQRHTKRAAAAAATTRIQRWLPEVPAAPHEAHPGAGAAGAASVRAPAATWSLGGTRGRYGESIVHILLINHTNEHLILLVLLLRLWPRLLFDAFESAKFRHLNCLHLAISQQNAKLLEHLLRLAHETDQLRARQLVEQRVSGSLFRPALSEMEPSAGKTMGSRSLLARTSSRISARASDGPGAFWCDQLAHWPTAHGARHLILFDRFRRAAQEAAGSNTSAAIYFGQTPLAWSVCFKSRAMFELLLELGRAEVNSCDSAGNNCLHQLVINGQLGWTRFLIKHKMSLAGENSMQLTPFLLACHLGRCELFVEFLELTAVEFWCYSSVRCCGYPLTSLDSMVGAHGPSKSAVSVILNSQRSSNEQKSALLSTNVVKKLLEEKWKIFARRLFYRDLLILLAQLALMVMASLFRPARVHAGRHSAPTETGSARQTWQRQLFAQLGVLLAADRQALFRRTCELAVVCIALNRLWSFGAEWIRHKNLRLQLTYNPLAANLVIANAFMLACVPVRSASFLLTQTGRTDANVLLLLDQLEDVLLIIASPLLWSSLLFFVAAFYVTGPFVAMINYMLMRDLRQFSLIYLIFLYAFAQCIFFVNYQPAAPAAAASASADNLDRDLEALFVWLAQLGTRYVELWLELFKMTLGVYEFQPFRHSILSRLFLMLFMHLIPILFNMLIAMMNNTYSLIISQSERAWSFQWARTLFALERRLDDHERLFYLKKYAINLSSSIGSDESKSGGGGGGDKFVPGLMIIKRTNCTRAEMRRKLIGYWQGSIKRVMQDLKQKADEALTDCDHETTVESCGCGPLPDRRPAHTPTWAARASSSLEEG